MWCGSVEEGVQNMVEHPAKVVRVRIMFFDLFGDDGGMWEVG